MRSVLLPDQPAVIGGPRKCMKTSLVLDMAISLGMGRPFLNHFKVPKPVRAAVISGESGGAELQQKARIIAASKKVALGDADVLWSFDLPKLAHKAHLTRLHDVLGENDVKVVFIDPLYLCLLGGGSNASASNLFDIGPILWGAAEACLTAGATPVLVHHTTKAASKDGYGGPLGLDHLAFAGIGEFARQWMVLNRKEPYAAGSGLHQLVLVAEGSAGHSGRWDVSVREGVLGEDMGGRRWQVQVNPGCKPGKTNNADYGVVSDIV